MATNRDNKINDCWLDARQAAAYLGLSLSYFRRWARKVGLQYGRPGPGNATKLFYRKKELDLIYETYGSGSKKALR